MAALTVGRLVALLADAVCFADAIRRDAARGGAEFDGDELADARAAIAEHEAEGKGVWRVTVKRPSGAYSVWHLRGTMFDVLDCLYRSGPDVDSRDSLVSAVREA